MSNAIRRRLAALLAVGLVGTLLGSGTGAEAQVASAAGVCDPIDPAACLLPFPNDLFTVPDATTATGRRVDLSPLAMPRSGTEFTDEGEGKPVDPTEWNRNDGFSPGSMVITYVPELDLHATWGTSERARGGEINQTGYFDHRDHIADIGLYVHEDAPIVILNAETGERHPFWSELDSHPGATEEQLLILRPAVNFEEGARYIVALRNLKSADGEPPLPPRQEFADYVSGNGADDDHQAHYDTNIFPVLDGAGIAKEELYLAWDFTVASERNLSERILHMRDDAFGRILEDTDLADRKVEGKSPAFVVDSSEARSDTWRDSRGIEHTQQIRRVRGRVTVPNYMDRVQQTEGHFRSSGQAGGIYYDVPAPGSRLLDIDGDGLPDQNPLEPTVNVPFVCDLVLDTGPRYGVMYGHGLLGTRDQIGDVRSPRRSGPFYGCAVDWWGMSTADVPTVGAILADLSNFPSLPDRAQQGFLNFMFLGRAMIHPGGFATDPAFQQDGSPLVASGTETPVYYDGNSQGGIMGGSLVAVSPDIPRAILGVPGMNYSTLLNRSVDYEGDVFGEATYAVYRDPIERQIVFSLMSMLWDRGEANGYAQHMTDDPLPNTPPHEVMLQVAYSDHQVANVSAEVEGRTIGAPIMVPGLPSGRHWEMDPYFSETATYPHQGSGLIYWDSGNASPPNGNLPPTHDPIPEDTSNGDPHGHPRSEPAAAWQEAQFLLTGWLVDVCEGGDYLTDNNPVNAGVPSCREPEYEAGTFPTSLTFTGNSAPSGTHSDPTVFEAALTDLYTGEPIAGVEVTFSLTGPDSISTFTAFTDALGIARVEPVIEAGAGDYVLSAGYPGEGSRSGTTVDAIYPIVPDHSVLTLTSQGRGASAQLIARLTDADSGLGISGAEISFYADDDLVGIASTDETGTASLPLTDRYRSGRYDFEAIFAGDRFYLLANAT